MCARQAERYTIVLECDAAVLCSRSLSCSFSLSSVMVHHHNDSFLFFFVSFSIIIWPAVVVCCGFATLCAKCENYLTIRFVVQIGTVRVSCSLPQQPNQPTDIALSCDLTSFNLVCTAFAHAQLSSRIGIFQFDSNAIWILFYVFSLRRIQRTTCVWDMPQSNLRWFRCECAPN